MPGKGGFLGATTKSMKFWNCSLPAPFVPVMCLAIAAVLVSAASAPAQGIKGEFKHLPPSEQLEQRCDMEAMQRLDADKVIAYTFSEPRQSDVEFTANGAVFRKRGEWYHLSYVCKTSGNHQTVTDFELQVGNRIPHRDWGKYYLYP